MTLQPALLNLSAYINQHLEDDLSLASLAARIHLSPFHFHRKFKAYFGESLHQHIKRLRLERAACELIHHTKSVHAIALDSGYKTVSAFSHAFASYSGRSPTRYRQEMLVGSLVRARGRLEQKLGKPLCEGLQPSWIGEIGEQTIAFLRAEGSGRGEQPAVRAAIETLAAAIGSAQAVAAVGSLGASPATPFAPSDAAPGVAPRPEFLAATIDLYGIAEHSRFRIDVGLDAEHVPPALRHDFGQETLPGGRYAMFDVRCQADEMLDVAYAAYLYWLPQSSEQPRSVPHYVRFVNGYDAAGDERDTQAARDYRLFIPLQG